MTKHRTTAWRHASDHLRLWVAGLLVRFCLLLTDWARGLAPTYHPGSQAVFKAAKIIRVAATALVDSDPGNTKWQDPVMVPCDLPKPPCRVLDVAAVVEDNRLVIGYPGVLQARRAGATHVRVRGRIYDITDWPR